MLAIKNLKHQYKEKIISYQDWIVQKGTHGMILGSSGSGKTTLLHLIAGLMQPTSGTIKVGDTEMTSLSGLAMDKFRGDQIGIVFQTPHLISSLSVTENIKMAQYLGGKDQSTAEIQRLINSLNIEDCANKKAHAISQGQAQRVSIARALINKPALLLADEPTASLDDQNCNQAIKLLIEQAKSSESTLVVATHDQRIKPFFTNQLVL